MAKVDKAIKKQAEREEGTGKAPRSRRVSKPLPLQKETEGKGPAGAPSRTAYAVGRYLRISPTKVRDILDLIRGKTVVEARRVLRFTPRKGAKMALKVLDSAVANARNRGAVNEEGWVVSEASADKGPVFRRRRDPKARGSWGMILTNSTHLRISVEQSPASNGGSRKESNIALTEKSGEVAKRVFRKVGQKEKKNVA